jgi:REP element-mobilizing transposase RayT
MSHTYAKLISHIIFSTKDRTPLITDEIRPKVHAYIGGIIRDLGGSALIVGGVEDHVHILTVLPPRLAPSDAMREIKAGSSRWIKNELGMRQTFAWQTGYAAFSVSQSRVPDTTEYIEAQEEHHRKKTFQEELVEFLEGYGVEYDEKYLWD